MKKIRFTLWVLCLATCLSAQTTATDPLTKNDMKKKILFAVTSHDQLGITKERTGFYLSEVAHPWKVLTDAGYDIDFVSPQGGKAPVDGLDLEDPVNRLFWQNGAEQEKIQNTLSPAEVNPSEYQVIFYAGGHGAMWDFPDNRGLADIARQIYEAGGIVAAVCHGPAAWVNLTLSDGNYLINGLQLTSFTNEEEEEIHRDQIVPFLLETKLTERGAFFRKAGKWHTFVVNDRRLITGQNPQSATAVGEEILSELRR